MSLVVTKTLYEMPTLKAITNSHSVRVKYCIRADYKFVVVVDKTVKCGHTAVYLDKGQEKTVTVGFKAEKHWLLRGYFVKVYIWQWDKTTWEMPSHYPPKD